MAIDPELGVGLNQLHKRKMMSKRFWQIATFISVNVFQICKTNTYVDMSCKRQLVVTDLTNVYLYSSAKVKTN